MITAQTLWCRALDEADMTGSAFPDLNFQRSRVNDALTELYYELVSADEDWFYKEAAPLSVVEGQSAYLLPDDFYKSLKLYLIREGRRFRVPKFNRSEVDGMKDSPQCTSAELTLCYVPKPTLFTDMSDEMSCIFPPGWEEYCVLHIAVKLLIKEESDARQLVAERDRKLDLIRRGMSPRDKGEHEHVADVSGRWSSAVQHSASSILDVQRFKYRIMGNQLWLYDTYGWPYTAW